MEVKLRAWPARGEDQHRRDEIARHKNREDDLIASRDIEGDSGEERA